jgi:hypothetical protein
VSAAALYRMQQLFLLNASCGTIQGTTAKFLLTISIYVFHCDPTGKAMTYRYIHRQCEVCAMSYSIFFPMCKYVVVLVSSGNLYSTIRNKNIVIKKSPLS